MALYKVSWTIEVDADTPEQAAGLAREIQQDPVSTATVFNVTRKDRKGTLHVIDTLEDPRLLSAD